MRDLGGSDNGWNISLRFASEILIKNELGSELGAKEYFYMNYIKIFEDKNGSPNYMALDVSDHFDVVDSWLYRIILAQREKDQAI
jgi:hypothetical protein